MHRYARSSLALALASAVVLAPALPASAAVEAWGPSVTISDSGQNAFEAHVASGGGTITAVWYRFDGSNQRIQAASSADGGTTWSTPATLSDPGENALDPRVVTDGTTITAAWRRWDGSSNRIQAASSSDGGTTWSTPTDLSEPGEGAAEHQLATDGTTITAVWYRSDGTERLIQATSSTDGGTTWSTPATLSEPGENAFGPQVVSDGTTITTVWRRFDGSNDRVQAASSTDGGTTWSTPATLSDPGRGAASPQVVSDGTTITAVWTRSDGSNFRIRAASSTDGGTTWSTPATLSDPGQGAFDPQIVTDGTTTTAVWYRSDGSSNRIQAASSTDGGATWSTPTTLSDPGQGAFDPQVVTDGTTITAVWTRSDGSDDRVQAASSTDGGTTWSTPTDLSDPGEDALEPQIDTDGTTVTAVWHRSDGSSFRIQASSFTSAEAGEGPSEPELAATGAGEALALSGIAAAILLAGGLLLARPSRGRATPAGR